MEQKNEYQPHRFPYIWRLSDGYPAKGIENHGCKVFGTFICGGGSTMGYKLAGYHHLGGVELDPSIAAIYKANHNPQYLYVEDIREFNKRTDLPDELYNLDILDGSPPCSTFSTAGSRENAWGKEKRFAEGQKMQRLDDLVFVYCDTIKKLMPKVCWLENVSGLVKGNAKAYAKRVFARLDEIGYNVQVFLLNGATMGVPQIRERSFFIGLRKDFDLPKLKLNFNEKPILFREFKDGTGPIITGDENMATWKNRLPTDKTFAETNLRTKGRNTRFLVKYIHDDEILSTLNATTSHALYTAPRWLSREEILKGTSFPLDYSADDKKILFLCGMSVAPIMSAQISWQIYKQWLSKI